MPLFSSAVVSVDCPTQLRGKSVLCSYSFVVKCKSKSVQIKQTKANWSKNPGNDDAPSYHCTIFYEEHGSTKMFNLFGT